MTRSYDPKCPHFCQNCPRTRFEAFLTFEVYPIQTLNTLCFSYSFASLADTYKSMDIFTMASGKCQKFNPRLFFVQDIAKTVTKRHKLI